MRYSIKLSNDNDKRVHFQLKWSTYFWTRPKMNTPVWVGLLRRDSAAMKSLAMASAATIEKNSR